MADEKILYGTRIGDEDWQEEIITTNAQAIDKAREWAMANGFDRLRVATFRWGEMPNFAKAVRK